LKRIFVDSGAFIALLSPADRYHELAASTWTTIADRPLLTTHLVIGEAATRLRYDHGPAHMLRLRTFLDSLPNIEIASVDTRIQGRAWDLLDRYSDLRLSYCDAVSAVIAKTQRCETVFGFDADFLVLGFSLLPGQAAEEVAVPYTATLSR
jgi:uncharacterized protein